MPNRLAHAQSLYLRKHADNPIDWYPWGEEALTKAQQENKPIFLSIGYSSCHWCTVMEGEAFSDPTIADYMNQQFVAIKVDREERPDIDSIYMQALQLMTGQGGWPLNVFLSPDDRLPFYGGTYFPLEPKYGRPGFLQILQALRRFYDTEPEKLTSVKAQLFDRLQQGVQLPEGDLSPELLQMGLEYSAGILSAKGIGPSFPMIPYATAALRAARFQSTNVRYDALLLCRQRGQDLALGGIYDQVAGGFHRYTVDATWTVPHFEKMLYDNGQMVEFLAELIAEADPPEPAFERAIQGTVAWLQREMTAPEGYFYAAQDADSFVTPTDVEPEEGAFYVWRYSELQQHLSDAELTELSDWFWITPEGNFEGQIVLQRQAAGALPESVDMILQKLFTLRYGDRPEALATFPPARNNHDAKTLNWAGRIPAVTDTKMIVAWNSLMISGLARAATVLHQPDYWQQAATAAQFILQHQRVDGRLHRLNYDGVVSVLAQSEDYALLIKALLDLQQATIALPGTAIAAEEWLTQAIALQTEFDDHLWSIELGGYYNTDARDDLVIRERSYDDNATPAANGIAVSNLVRLALLTDDLAYLDRAEQTLQSFSHCLSQTPQACPSLFAGLDWFRNATLIRTDRDRISTLARQYLPTAVWQVMDPLPDGAIALVCQGLSCNEPARDPAQLQQQLHQSLTRS